MSKSLTFQPNQRVLDEFFNWIEQPQFDQRHARHWGELYNNHPEAAMCEATFWAVLTDCGVSVSPNRYLDESKPSPDFLCHKGGVKFYVEVTCIQENTATRATSLAPVPYDKPSAQC